MKTTAVHEEEVLEHVCMCLGSQKVKMARNFAIQAHGDQKYGDDPYIRHLDDVAMLAASYGHLAIVVAYLHDVIEDTDKTAGDIRAHFGSIVTASVLTCTDKPGRNRRERKARTNEKLSDSMNTTALIVKACDRLANVRECVRTNDSRIEMYRREYPAFREAAYRAGLCESVWAELDELMKETL